MTVSISESVGVTEDVTGRVQNVSSFRRVLPQLLASLAKNLLFLNIGEFFSISSIAIPSLTGLSNALNPDETVQITAVQSSWLFTLSHVAHPIGGLLSAPINDRIGRRKAIMLVNIPLIIGWIVLGFSYSFPVICLIFTLLGFSFGLKEAPVHTYICEISEPSVRGIMSAITPFAFTTGSLIVMALGSVFSWRQVALSCAIFPFCCLIAVIFVAESPSWLLSKDRPKDAQKSLQWLRGWVSPQTVQQELNELQNYNNSSIACVECSKKALRCQHSNTKFCDKIKELGQPRHLRPLTLMTCLYLFGHFSVARVWDPYIIQVLIAFGTPIDPNLTTVLITATSILGCFFLIATVKCLGRRKIYLISSLIVTFCSIALGIYGLIFFPLDWISFQRNPPMDPQRIQNIVGNYGYLPVILILIMKFFARVGSDGIIALFIGEIFSHKMRSFLCGMSLAISYLIMSIATKTYYNVEMLLSLPGATLFYGTISLIGFFVMYAIMPETEQRSLEDIELHYSDTSKRITDIHIIKHSIAVESK